MCGIFAYSGTSRDASAAVVEGLKRLDYRGYDSWGVACLAGGFSVVKDVGPVDQGASLPPAEVAIGHTRWATHGTVSITNAHPHAASDGSFLLAHNGIVENFGELKADLEKRGYPFSTQTDTEAIVRLIERVRRRAKNLPSAVRAAFLQLAGRNTIIVLSADGSIIAARNGSPLVLGRGAKGDLYLSSDILSFAAHVREVSVLDNGMMVVIRGKDAQALDTLRGAKRAIRFEKNAIVGQEVSKGAYEHFMIKEIHEAPRVLFETARQGEREMRALAKAAKSARHVYCVGSGTAGAAAAQIAYYLRTIGRISATALIGAEASDYYGLFRKGDLMIAPSQSGETADVLEVLEIAKKRGVRIASHVNMPGSYMTRISDFPFMAQAGPEICVMSTKIFVAQIAWGYLLAKTIARAYAEGVRDLTVAARKAQAMLKDTGWITGIRSIARSYAKEEHLFLLAKGQNLQIMKEAMVKIIEGSYVHAHGIPAGDLKHYAITLMEEATPVIAVTSEDSLAKDIESAVHEVRARGAAVTVVGSHSVDGLPSIAVPETPGTGAMLNIVALQLLAYYMAVARGTNVDKPRNIAKSVTVK